MVYNDSFDYYLKDVWSLKLNILTKEQEKELGRAISEAETDFRKCVLTSAYGTKTFYDFYKKKFQAVSELKRIKPDGISDKTIKVLDDLVRADEESTRLFSDVLAKYENAVEKARYYNGLLSEQCGPNRKRHINVRLSNLREEFGADFETAYKEMRHKYNSITAAEHKLAESNLRFVISIAQKYRRTGIPMSDLVGWGNIGLMLAVKRFNPENGNKLATFAYKCIKHRIERAINLNLKAFGIPNRIAWKILKYKKINSQFIGQYGRKPDDEEMAERMDIPVKDSCLLREKISSRTSSIDMHLNDDTEASMRDMITYSDKEERNTNIPNIDRSTLIRLMGKFEDIDERAKPLLIGRFGLDGNEPKTLEALGNELGITRERVRQIETKSLRRLRAWILEYMMPTNKPAEDKAEEALKTVDVLD